MGLSRRGCVGSWVRAADLHLTAGAESAASGDYTGHEQSQMTEVVESGNPAAAEWLLERSAYTAFPSKRIGSSTTRETTAQGQVQQVFDYGRQPKVQQTRFYSFVFFLCQFNENFSHWGRWVCWF